MSNQQPPEIGGFQEPTLIGEGGMARIWRFKDVKQQMYKAVKVALDADKEIHLERELSIGKKLGDDPVVHKGIVLPCDSRIVDGKRLVIFPWISGANLRIILDKAKESGYWERELRRCDIVIYIGQLLFSILVCLHRNNIAHFDISLENIIVTPDGEVKVVDLGAADRYAGTPLPTRFGKAEFAAPEQQEGKGVLASDVHSAAKVLCVLAGAGPADDPPAHLPQALRKLLALSLHKTPGERPPAEVVLTQLSATVPEFSPEQARRTLASFIRYLASVDDDVAVERQSLQEAIVFERKARTYLFISAIIFVVLFFAMLTLRFTTADPSTSQDRQDSKGNDR